MYFCRHTGGVLSLKSSLVGRKLNVLMNRTDEQSPCASPCNLCNTDSSCGAPSIVLQERYFDVANIGCKCPKILKILNVLKSTMF